MAENIRVTGVIILLIGVITPFITGRAHLAPDHFFLKTSWVNLDLYKVILYGFYHGKSPLNHHLGEDFLELFATTLSKSKWNKFKFCTPLVFYSLGILGRLGILNEVTPGCRWQPATAPLMVPMWRRGEGGTEAWETVLLGCSRKLVTG